MKPGKHKYERMKKNKSQSGANKKNEWQLRKNLAWLTKEYQISKIISKKINKQIKLIQRMYEKSYKMAEISNSFSITINTMNENGLNFLSKR